jgi:hypothetical protein
MIRIMEIANWKTTSPLRSIKPCLFDLNLPLSTVIGLKDDNINAG